MKKANKEKNDIKLNNNPYSNLDYYLENAYYDMRFYLKSITDSVSTVYTYFGDLRQNLFYISDNFRDAFGFESNVVPGLKEKWKKFIYKEQWRQYYERDLKNVLKNKIDKHDIRYQVKDKSGKVKWVHNYGAIKWSEDKSIPLFVTGRIILHDDCFSVDPLTNFISEQSLSYKLKKLKDLNYKCTTIGFSFNNMSAINAKFGKYVGDQLIFDICQSLMDKLIGKMSFYRILGLRCFAVVDNELEETDEELVGQIREIIENGYKKLNIHVNNPCSFVVMKFPQENVEPKDFIERMVSLIRLASRTANLDFITDIEENLNTINEQATLKIDLSNDVLNGMKNFKAVIQPVVLGKTDKIMAGEILMRWQHNGQNISPAVFIPILEQNNLIQIAGKWIFKQAVKYTKKIVEYNPDFKLSVNVSVQQMSDDNLLGFIFKLLDSYELDASHIVIEITENYMIEEPKKFIKMIEECHSRGIWLALDDFGTGYSSIRTIMHYDIDLVKVDRSLLLEIEESSVKASFVGSMIDACHKLDKLICIEGVETEIHRDLVKQLNTDYIQGFYYYRPMPIEEVLNVIKN